MQDISSYPVVSLKLLCLNRVGRNLCMKHWTRKRAFRILEGMWNNNSSLPLIPNYLMNILIRFVQIWSFPKSPTIRMLEPLLNTGKVTELELYFDLKMQKTWNLLEALAKNGKQFTSIKFYNNQTELLGFCRTTLKMVPPKIKNDLCSLFTACENLEILDIHVPFDIKVLHGNLKLKSLTLRFYLSNICDLIPEEDSPKGELHTLSLQDNNFRKEESLILALLKSYPHLKKVSSIHTRASPFYPNPFDDTRQLNPLNLTWLEVATLSYDVLEFAKKSCPNLNFLNFKVPFIPLPLQNKLAQSKYSLGIVCYNFGSIDAYLLNLFEKLGKQIKRLYFCDWSFEMDVKKLDLLCPNLEYLEVTVRNLRLFAGDGSCILGHRDPYSNLKEFVIRETCVKIGEGSLSYLLNNCKKLEKLHLQHVYDLTDDILFEILRSDNLQNLKLCFLLNTSLSLYGLQCLLTSAKSLEKLCITLRNATFDEIQYCVDRINPSIVNFGIPYDCYFPP